MQWVIGCGAIGFIAGCCLLLYMFAQAASGKLTTEHVDLPRLPKGFDGTTILLITDLHKRTISADLLAKCAEARPELVLVGGDLLERGVPLARVKENMRTLRALGPVYAVYGNHDYEINIRELDVLLGEEGVRLLMNEAVLLEKEDQALWLLGVDDPHTSRDRLDQAIAYRDEEHGLGQGDAAGADGCTILLAHSPEICNRIGRHEIDLVLAGHTHGGQIVLPWYGPLVKLDYLHGWFTLANSLQTRVFVSKGYGTSRMPLRLGAPPEAHIIVLHRSGQGREAQS